MKKLLTGIATIALVILAGSITAFAARNGRNRNFVDNDKSGICDYCNTSCEFVDNDGDGICDNCGLGMHEKCNGFADTDGDGICDNYGSNSCGKGAGFVDADGDCIRDNIGKGTSQYGSGSKRECCSGQGRRCRY